MSLPALSPQAQYQRVHVQGKLTLGAVGDVQDSAPVFALSPLPCPSLSSSSYVPPLFSLASAATFHQS